MHVHTPCSAVHPVAMHVLTAHKLEPRAHVYIYCICIYTAQNWSHVRSLFEQLNALPTQQHETDFARVRSWYLDANARRLRQTVVLAAHPSAELSSLMRGCTNTAGSVRLGRASYGGTLAASPPGLRQLFVRFEAADPAAVADARLDKP